MVFDNKSIRQVVNFKPHIVKIDGYWRVSALPKFITKQGGIREKRWVQANFYAAKKNNYLPPTLA